MSSYLSDINYAKVLNDIQDSGTNTSQFFAENNRPHSYCNQVMFNNHQSANVAHNNYYVQESIGRWKPVVLKNGNKIKLSDSGKFKQVNLYPKIPGWKYHLLPRDK